MSIYTALIEITKNFHADVYSDLEKIKFHIIVRLLDELDWKNNLNDVTPGYVLGKSTIDFALLHGSAPCVLIKVYETPNWDAVDEADLFDNAYKQNIPFVILTNGKTWSFYLCTKGSDASEQLFLILDLMQENDFREIENILKSNLHKESIISGIAQRNAEIVLDKRQKRKVARQAIPKVWASIIGDTRSLLYILIEEEVEKSTGHKPYVSDIASFLQKPKLPKSNISTQTKSKTNNLKTRIKGFNLFGDKFSSINGRATLKSVILKLAQRNQDFMEKLHGITETPKRCLVARDRSELFKAAPHLTDKNSIDLGNSWWLNIHHSNNNIRQIVKTACGIAGIEYGKDLVLIEEPISK